MLTSVVCFCLFIVIYYIYINMERNWRTWSIKTVYLVYLCITLCIIGPNHSPNFTKQIDTDKNFFQIFTADIEMTDEILLDMKSENNNKTK